METRALHIFWPQALKAPARTLDDLARYTDVNTLILDAAYLAVEDPAEATVLARVYGNRYLVPSTAPFGDLAVAGVEEADYAAALGFMDLARSRGFSISCHVLPINPNPPGLSHTACVDVSGAPALDEDVAGARDLGGLKFAHACPNNPEVQRFGETLVRAAIAAWPGLEMLDLNHLEFPHWPRTGLGEMFVCFCDSCHAAAEAQGLDFEAMKREVASLHEALCAPGGPREARVSANTVATALVRRPMLAAWFNFRLASMSAHIERLANAAREAAAAHNPGLKLGTDLDLCGRLFDWVSLYPNAYDPEIIARQMPHLATLKGKMPLYAWTWLDNRDYDGWRRKFEALRDADLDGYFLWCWESDLTPEALAASKGIF